eukprot:TRINITY_DN31_c0_g1_i2.p1 TRINITY_DN31_c0_g1~~TRINITY_DN31_c0_g1_i2.p1  ORF type:complete len:418 (+),score=72.36 TRINITY_DN31_c0_g1_i2:549-1802(+)
MGRVDPRVIEQNQRKAKELGRGTWFLSYIMDTNEEEREKGKTVELGKAYFESEKRSFTVLDAPGHRQYVPNMVNAYADVAILVISAKSGEFEAGFGDGQTREHALLAWSIGIRKFVVVINKMDEVSVNWSRARFDECVAAVVAFFKTLGVTSKDLSFLPISGFLGTNIKDRLASATCSWWDGKSLLETLEELPMPSRDFVSPAHLPISGKYRDQGLVHVLGKLETGRLVLGQRVRMLPSKLEARVQFICLEECYITKEAEAGDNVRVGLAGIDENEIHLGHVMEGVVTTNNNAGENASAINNLQCVDKFLAQMLLLEMPSSSPIFTTGVQGVLHIHTTARECRVEALLSEIDKKSKKVAKKKPTFAKKGALVELEFVVTQPVCIDVSSSSSSPCFNRFVFRDKGKTVGVGKVLSLSK